MGANLFGLASGPHDLSRDKLSASAVAVAVAVADVAVVACCFLRLGDPSWRIKLWLERGKGGMS